MANPNKAKGTKWESDVRDDLNVHLGLYVGNWRDKDVRVPFRDPRSNLNVKRQAQEGAHDVGDLHAWPFIVECKDVVKVAVPTWIRQGLAEAHNAGFPYSVVVHKLRGSNVRNGRVHIDVRTWTRVRLALGLSSWQMWMRYGFSMSAPMRGIDTSRWYFTTDLVGFRDILRDIRAAEA